MSDLANWFDAIKEIGEQRKKEDKEFNQTLKLNPPDSVYESFCFWKTQGGIIRIRKKPNGMYNRYSETFISDKEIDAMVKAKTCLD